MDNTIYYILAGLFLIYILITAYNKKSSRRRKSRRFMEGYERKRPPKATKEEHKGEEKP